jgi:putative endonuclease
VARWYEHRGGRVLARNWRSTAGELDLVVAEGATVVFCEVKTRTSARFGSGLEAVGPDKCRRIRRLAAAWLAAHRAAAGPTDVRFDVASVTDGRVEVVADAF